MSSDRNIVKEAVADAKVLREAALDVAKQKLVEELSPAIKNFVEKTLNSTNEDTDRLRRAADGYGETEFEEGKDIEGDMEMEKDKDLEEALGSMFPGIAEEDEPAGDELEEADDMDLDDLEEGIPTLGEGDDLEGDMDEEVSIDEEGLRKAYESLMASNRALAEAQVSSGFKDSYKTSEWETEDSPPSDRGLAGKEKDNAWEEEKPPAATDHTVKEAIEKGLRENAELRRYVMYLENINGKALGMIKTLKKQVAEVNLFNSKVLHVNEMFHKFGKNLTKEQKSIVLKQFDKASNVKEVKMVSEALKASFKSTLKESHRRRGNRADAQRRTTSGSPNQKVLRESVNRRSGGDQYARMRELAGIVGSE